MFASREPGQGKFVMRAGRRADVDQMELRIGQQFEIASGRLEPSRVQYHWLIGANVAAHFREVSIQMPPAGIAEGRHLNSCHLAISPDMSGSHKAKANNADVDHITARKPIEPQS